MKAFPISATFLMITAIACAGCSKGSSLATVPVKGKITFRGQALSGASVAFISQDKSGKPASGMTDAQGEYALTTMETPTKIANGALPGSYKVTVTKLKKSSDQELMDRVGQMTPEEMQKLSPEEAQKLSSMNMPPDPSQQQSQPKEQSEIPARYNLADGSGLTATVKPGQAEPINFELTE